MQLAMVAAGFSGGEADALRRAMAAWKRKGGLSPYKEKLINWNAFTMVILKNLLCNYSSKLKDLASMDSPNRIRQVSHLSLMFHHG